MPIEILMPALSPTMTQGNLAKWCKKEGDKVKSGEILAEIETDKATMEVESIDDGILGKIFVPEGTNDVKVNSLIALLLEDGESRDMIEKYQPKSALKEAAVNKEAAPAKIEAPQLNIQGKQQGLAQRIFASPLARKIAEQNNVNLAGISGTGPRGRIVKDDVLAAGAGRKSCSANLTRNDREYDVLPISNMRKIIASRLVESKQTIPHFYLSVDCEMDALLEMRSGINDLFAENKSTDKISVNDLIIKASAMALRDIPDANVSWMEEGIYRYNNVDISVAVSIDGGLITPIIRNADQKTISQISSEMKSLAQRARTTGLAPHEFQGGGFSISNLGMYGIKQFNAIISPPQGCILAVGATEKRAVVDENDNFGIANVMTLSLSCDHRVIDGAVGAEFLAALKKYLQSPILLFKDWL